MPAGKQNNIRSKLEGLDNVPDGFRFDSSKTWQRLESRLVTGRKRRMTGWYYVAAAILILVIAGSILLKKNTGEPSKQPVATKPAEKKEIANQHIKKQEQQQPIIESIKKPVRESEKKLVDPRLVDPAPVELQEITVNTSPALTDTISVNRTTEIVVKELPKPKFKLAHINELNITEPVIPPAKNATANTFKKPPFASVSGEPLSQEEKIIFNKKRSTLALISSSQ